MIAGCSPAPAAESDGPAKGGAASGRDRAAAAATGNEGKTMGEVSFAAGWFGEEPEIADDAIASVTDADIVVCGGGHAGTKPWLRRASELGKKAVVVEMQPEDTFSALGNDIGHLNLPQVDRGVSPSTTGRRLHERVQMYAAGRAQPTLISQFANRLRRGPRLVHRRLHRAGERRAHSAQLAGGGRVQEGPLHLLSVGTCQFEAPWA